VLGALVGRITHVPVAQAGGFDAQIEAGVVTQTSEDSFRGGRTANVSGADE
jgi:hypothetical protein